MRTTFWNSACSDGDVRGLQSYTCAQHTCKQHLFSSWKCSCTLLRTASAGSQRDSAALNHARLKHGAIFNHCASHSFLGAEPLLLHFHYWAHFLRTWAISSHSRCDCLLSFFYTPHFVPLTAPSFWNVSCNAAAASIIHFAERIAFCSVHFSGTYTAFVSSSLFCRVRLNRLSRFIYFS